MGLVWGLCLEEWGHEVAFLDKSEELCGRLRGGEFSTWEPGVNELLKTHAINARTWPASALRGAEWVDIFVPTPSSPSGAFDSSIVAAVLREVTECVAGGITAAVPLPIVVKSTTWPGQMEELWGHGIRCDKDLVRLYYAPELVALGEVLHGMMFPDMQILGVPPGTWEADPVIRFYKERTKNTYVLSWTEAEMVKLTINATLSARAAMARQIDRLCSRLPEADGSRVMLAVGGDPRIGHAFHRPGPMPGGPCLPRDTRALIALAEALTVTGDETFRAPARESRREVEEMLEALVSCATVGIIGMAYKPGVPIMEGTTALPLIGALRFLGTEVLTWCPYVETESILTAVLHCDGIVVLLNDPEIVKKMRKLYFLWKDKVVIDPWGQL